MGAMLSKLCNGGVKTVRTTNDNIEFKPEENAVEVEAEGTVKACINVKAVENILGYEFQEPSWAEAALTHPSYRERRIVKDGCRFERLEFLGDAVLNHAVALALFAEYKELDEGSLTHLRSANVETENLARISVKHDLFQYMIHHCKSFETEKERFTNEIAQFPIRSNGLLHTLKFLADVVEALIGAVSMDSGSLDKSHEVAKKLLEPMIKPEQCSPNPVSAFNDYCQKNKIKVKWEKKAFNDSITSRVLLLNGVVIGTGVYYLRKDIAKNRAAKDALSNLENDESLLAQALESSLNIGSDSSKDDSVQSPEGSQESGSSDSKEEDCNED